MKILVVSHNSFSKIYNNGKTIRSIFSSFPKESLAQIYFTENMYPDFDFCNDYFKITDVNVLKSALKGGADCGEVLLKRENVAEHMLMSKGSRVFRFAKSKVDHLVLFRDLLWNFNVWRSPSLIRWCKKIDPDIIFFVGGNFGFSHKIAAFLSKDLRVPMVSYFTDDYLIYPDNKNIFDRIQKVRMKKFYTETINHSSLCFVIGDYMAKEYSAFFDKKFYSIMNSIEKQDYLPYFEKKEVIFSYFGGLHLNRWKMLTRLADSLTEGKINVYSIEKPLNEVRDEFEKHGINYMGSVEGEDLKKAILDSDVLLHVESDDSYNRSFTKLSISTKIPEYLMSGRMVLGFGPDEVASMKILSDNEIGVVISSSTSKNCLREELLKITSDFKFREKIGLQGYNYAVKNFDNKVIADDFKMKMENLILDNGNTK